METVNTKGVMMSDIQNQTPYPTGPAALFHAAAVTEGTRVEIWAYCPICWDRTAQVYEGDEGKFECYRCETCGTIHKIAVR